MVTGPDIIGILGFSFHTIHRLYKYGKKWIDAPQELRDLLVEVSHVEGIIKQILEANAGPERASLDVLKFHPELMKQMEELADAARVFVEKMTTVKDDGIREVKRIKWMFKASEVKDLTTKFQAFYGAISAIYAVNNSVVVRSIEPSMLEMGRSVVVTVERSTYAAQHQLASTLDRTLRQTIREERVRLVEELREALARTVVRTLASAARDQRDGCNQLFDELSILRDHPQATHGLLDSSCYLELQDTRRYSTRSLIRRPSTSSVDDDRISVMTSSTCDSLDTVSPHSRSRSADSGSSQTIPQLHCPPECSCRCHQSSSECQLMTSVLTSSRGMHILGALMPSLGSPTLSCDDTGCVRNRASLLTMRRLFPGWFAQVEGTIRFQSCPVHFKIPTPRIVQCLSFLAFISLDQFRMKLTNREITVNDIQRNGFTILHALVQRIAYEHKNRSEIYEMMHLAVDAGARSDWEYIGLTATQYMVYSSKEAARDTSIISATPESFDRNIAKPLLGESVAEAWDTVRAKHDWSDLRYLLVNPPSSPEQLKYDLAVILSRPSAALDVNAKDRFEETPLRHAIWACPEAVDALLRAGANPGPLVDSPLNYTAAAQSWSAIGPLVRAGANVNKRLHWSDGVIATPLNNVIRTLYARPGDRLRTALELVRHGGHVLDWDIQDEHGDTPLASAERLVNEEPDNEEVTSLYELYKTQKLPSDAQLINRSRLEHEERVVGFVSTSLIKAGLKGNINAIGALISAGAMVNERDEVERTLLHLVAMGVVLNGYSIAIEVVRYGGYGVDWDALTADGETAEVLAERTLEHLSTRMRTTISSFTKRKLQRMLPARLQRQFSSCYKITQEEAVKILELLRRRALPQGIDYIYPCMDPNYCRKCSSLPCTGNCPQ